MGEWMNFTAPDLAVFPSASQGSGLGHLKKTNGAGVAIRNTPPAPHDGKSRRINIVCNGTASSVYGAGDDKIHGHGDKGGSSHASAYREVSPNSAMLHSILSLALFIS